MADNRFPYTPELAPFWRAFDAWLDEIIRVYGPDSGAGWDERGRGAEGSHLRKLWDARHAARQAWLRSAA